MEEIIKIKNVKKRFNHTEVLKGIHLNIQQGEKLMLLGKSGSGKTTLLKLLNLLERPSSGEIVINNKSLSSENPVHLRRQIGYVIQKVGLLPHLTILDNLDTPAKIIGKKRQPLKFYEELMAMVKLDPDYLTLYPKSLSGGQQQRVGIARAMVNDPEIILMDEPFSALDPITRSQLQNDLLELETLKNKTIVMVTHDIEEAMKVGDRIALLDQGTLQQVGSPKQILFDAHNAFNEEFIGKDRFRLKMQIVHAKDLGLEEDLPDLNLFEILSDNGISNQTKSKVMNRFYELESRD